MKWDTQHAGRDGELIQNFSPESLKKRDRGGNIKTCLREMCGIEINA